VTLDAGGQQTAVKRYRGASPKRSGGDYSIAGQQVAVRDSSGTFCLVTDHPGSVVSVLDGSGAQVYEQRYREASRSGADGPPVRPTSAEHRRPADRPRVHWPTRTRSRRPPGLQRAVVRRCPGHVQLRRQLDPEPIRSAFAQPVRLCPEQPSSVHRSHGPPRLRGAAGRVLVPWSSSARICLQRATANHGVKPPSRPPCHQPTKPVSDRHRDSDAGSGYANSNL